MAIIGSMAPVRKETAEDTAACHGFVNPWGSIWSSASECAAKASWAVSSVATCRAVLGDRPFDS
ncbi:Uncharacterised protein [Mycobacteroides abscessus subsp. massiliense]|nr:Uncharacterised protein [Mycobacteroides abscessus subsp. massiliense]